MNSKYRRDNRTKRQFTSDIKNRTMKEKFLVELFIKECLHRGHSIFVEDYGIDNTGAYVEVANCSPDYKITINGSSGLYEIKCSPVVTRCTFKKHSLKKYVEYNANILLFYGAGFIDRDTGNLDIDNIRWAIIDPKTISKILKDKTPYIEPLFGNKPCVKILQKEYDKYFISYELKHLEE